MVLRNFGFIGTLGKYLVGQTCDCTAIHLFSSHKKQDTATTETTETTKTAKTAKTTGTTTTATITTTATVTTTTKSTTVTATTTTAKRKAGAAAPTTQQKRKQRRLAIRKRANGTNKQKPLDLNADDTKSTAAGELIELLRGCGVTSQYKVESRPVSANVGVFVGGALLGWVSRVEAESGQPAATATAAATAATAATPATATAATTAALYAFYIYFAFILHNFVVVETVICILHLFSTIS